MGYRSIVFVSTALLAAGMDLQGADPKNETITLTSGSYTVDVSVKYKLTPRRIVYDGFEIGTPSGFYGTVIVPESGKYIGAGHTEGGTEQVLDSALYIDGEKKDIAPGNEYSGKKIVLEKTSMLDKLKFKVTIEISPDGIVERKSYEALDDQPIHQFIAYLYCFNPSTTDWAAEVEDGSVISGVFKNDKSWHLQKDVKWAAQFDSAAKKGFVVSFPKVIKGNIHKSAFWDIPKRYHKYYLNLDTPPVISKGFKSDELVLELRGFSAEPGNWAEMAK